MVKRETFHNRKTKFVLDKNQERMHIEKAAYAFRTEDNLSHV